MKIGILAIQMKRYQRETNQTDKDMAKEFEISVPLLEKIYKWDVNLTNEEKRKVIQCRKYMSGINGYGLIDCETHMLSFKAILEYDPKIVQEIQKQERRYIEKHPEFSILGVKAKDFVYDGSSRLYLIKEGYCRVTEHQLFRAMRDKTMKKKLEKECKFGNLTNELSNVKI